MPEPPRRFVIVGGGLVGSMLAALLGRRGFEVEVLERRGDPREGRMDAGRSINLAISARGLNALAALDLNRTVLDMSIPLFGRLIHPVRGPYAFQGYGIGGQAINSVSRADLNQLLIETAAESGRVRFWFRRRCVDLDPARGIVTHVESDSDADHRTAEGIVIAADGAYSTIRGLLREQGHLTFVQDSLSHGYKELFIPPGPDQSPLLAPNAMHIWARRDFMMMAMANRDNSFTVTLYLPKVGPNSFERLRYPEDLLLWFKREFPDAAPLMPSLTDDFFSRPVGEMVTVRTSRWSAGGRVVLVGDAAHAIVPFYGQGANAGFEDCLALVDYIGDGQGDLDDRFRRFGVARKLNTDAIADLALANFQEMRAHVASPWFRLQKRLEKTLHANFPKRFVPLYSMISFSTIPYADAIARAERQSIWVRRVAIGIAMIVLASVILVIALS